MPGPAFPQEQVLRFGEVLFTRKAFQFGAEILRRAGTGELEQFLFVRHGIAEQDFTGGLWPAIQIDGRQHGFKRVYQQPLFGAPARSFFPPTEVKVVAEFEAVGAQRVGISADDVAKQKKFSEKHEFDYPLLSDPDGAVATQFGVRRRFTKLSPTKRATFVIGSDLTVLDVIQSEVRMNVHADRALEVLKAASSS